jgi:hypothetical protein
VDARLNMFDSPAAATFLRHLIAAGKSLSDHW